MNVDHFLDTAHLSVLLKSSGFGEVFVTGEYGD
jgi:hypothetical protein